MCSPFHFDLLFCEIEQQPDLSVRSCQVIDQLHFVGLDNTSHRFDNLLSCLHIPSHYPVDPVDPVQYSLSLPTTQCSEEPLRSVQPVVLLLLTEASISSLPHPLEPAVLGRKKRRRTAVSIRGGKATGCTVQDTKRKEGSQRYCFNNPHLYIVDLLGHTCCHR